MGGEAHEKADERIRLVVPAVSQPAPPFLHRGCLEAQVACGGAQKCSLLPARTPLPPTCFQRRDALPARQVVPLVSVQAAHQLFNGAHAHLRIELGDRIVYCLPQPRLPTSASIVRMHTRITEETAWQANALLKLNHPHLGPAPHAALAHAATPPTPTPPSSTYLGPPQAIPAAPLVIESLLTKPLFGGQQGRVDAPATGVQKRQQAGPGGSRRGCATAAAAAAAPDAAVAVAAAQQAGAAAAPLARALGGRRRRGVAELPGQRHGAERGAHGFALPVHLCTLKGSNELQHAW